MIKRLWSGVKVGFHGLEFMLRNPKTLISIVVFWVTLTFIYSIVYFLFSKLDVVNSIMQQASLFVSLVFIVSAFSFSTSIASLVLLELIEQYENTKAMSIVQALKDTFKRDLLKTIPIIILWSVVILIIRLIQTVITLAIMFIALIFRFDFDVPGKVSSSFFNVLSKGLRVFMLFSLPAIAWEELGTIQAIQKSWKVIKETWAEIIGAIIFSNMITILMLIPLSFLYYLYQAEVISSDAIVIIVFILSMFIFSLSNMIQQLYSAEIYLWFLRWEEEVQYAYEHGEFEVDFEDYEKPSLLRK